MRKISKFIWPAWLRASALPVLLGISFLGSQAQAQVTVQVDSTKAWGGWMNVYELTAEGAQGGYLWGSGWGADALRAIFAGTSTLTLTPNTNVSNPSDAYWVKPDGTGNKWMEASFYVESTAFGGQTVDFIGMVVTNSLQSPWRTIAVIKEFAPGYAWVGQSEAELYDGSIFNVTRTIAPGNIAQYGFVTAGPNCSITNLANAGMVVVQVNNSDPSITQEPVTRRIQVGDQATFTVTAVGSTTLGYQWKRDGTNLLDGGNISGAKTATLTIANAQLSDATTYGVTVSNTAGTLDSATARLRVLSPADFANALDNPSFEQEVVDPVQIPPPWNNFSGSALANTNDSYYNAPGLYILGKDGTNVARVFNAGEWNGFYQDVPAAPGDVFTADGWFYLSSYDGLLNDTSAHLEIQFRAGPTPLAMYTSADVGQTNELDNWMFLQATNGVPSGFTQITTTNSYYLVAPPATTTVRYQITLHNVAAGSGNVYVDQLRFMKKLPVTVSIAPSGNQVVLSWLTQGATDYQIVYKDSFSDASWTLLPDTIAGDGSVKTASLPKSGNARYYRVITK